MKRNAATSGNWSPRGKTSAGGSVDVLTPRPATAQEFNSIADQLAGDGIGVASLWKSPRNREQAVQITLKSYEGNPYADLRLYQMDPLGRMKPTSKGVTVSMSKLPALAQAIGAAYKKAVALGLIPATGLST